MASDSTIGEIRERLTAHCGYSSGLVGSLPAAKATAAAVADAIADETAEPRVVFLL